MVSLHLPETERRSAVRWISPEPGLWEATRRGEPIGAVRRRNGSYHATSGRGRDLGSFDGLDAALSVVDGTGDPSADPRRRGVLTVVLCAIIGGSAVGAVVLVVALFRG
jgi:hypothetical protein